MLFANTKEHDNILFKERRSRNQSIVSHTVELHLV